ncbi:MAG: amino acid ABC transporter ATP-binding protein [Rhodobacteraceae bacterium]|nr:amino acid ABC transporter ATP-binding protein [Paracoccaceae bacterium]
MSGAPVLPLRLEGALVRVHGKVITGPINLMIKGGGLSVLVGPNGAGKTSILRMLHGLTPLSEGTLSWQGGTRHPRSKMGYVFQTPVLLHRNVLENLTYPLRLSGLARGKARARACAALERVGLDTFASHPARTLSGGERQKLAVARALIREPELLLLDEPCASLDGNSTSAIEDILCAARASGTRIVMATHDMGQARRLADEVFFIHKGQVHEEGSAATFFDRPKTPEARAFLQGDILA